MSKLIFEAELEYRPGYIEIENEQGERVYQPTAETLEKERLIAENISLKAQVKAQSETQAFQEECLIEMAGVVYA